MRGAKALAYSSLLLGVFLCSGCDDPDFGDKALRFVKDSLPGISRQLARADLVNRWNVTYSLLLVDTRARLLALRDLLPQLADGVERAAGSGEKASQRLRSIRDIEGQLLEALRRYEDLKEQVANGHTMCGSRSLFRQAGLEELGLLAVLRSLHTVTPEISVGISVGDGSSERNAQSWSKTIEQLFVARKVEEQNKKLREALELAPQIVPRGDELFAISREVCTQALARASDALNDLDASARSAGLALQDSQRYASTARRLVEQEAVQYALGWTSPNPVVAAARYEDTTGAASELRGRLRTEFQLAENSIARGRNDGTARGAYLQERAAADREFLLATLGALRAAKVDSLLGDGFLSELESLKQRLEAESP